METPAKVALPIAVCGMACRLPGGIDKPQKLWDFLVAGENARTRVPKSRFNVDSFFSSENRPGTVKDQFGYFIEEDLAAFDGAAFNIAPTILEQCDPQQRKLLEVAQECLDDAGETKARLQKVGVYVGSFAQDWSDMMEKDPLALGAERAMDGGAFSLANRLSHAMDLRGPSMTIQTACSASLVALNAACLAIANGDCASAIVAGVNLILSPSMTGKISDQGVLSSDGSCKSFSADANGYSRGEAVNAIFITSMDAALRNGNPVRAVIRASLANSDGKTAGLSNPSMEAQEALIRQTYHLAGISDFSKTAFVECHGTGTPTGDPIEVGAVANVFGPSGVYIGSVKPNLGHSEGASGLTSLIKAILAVEHRAIPPNIRFSTPHPRIPFYQAGLTVPLKLTPWPEDRDERVSVSSFGIGGSNAHVIVESARSYGVLRKRQYASRDPQLLVFSAHSSASLNKLVEQYTKVITDYPSQLSDLAYTLAVRRHHLTYRAFMVSKLDYSGPISQMTNVTVQPNVVMLFTGQGAQWAQMGRDLLRINQTFRMSITMLDEVLQALSDFAPSWTIAEELSRPARSSRLKVAELAQPLCTAIQIALVDTYVSLGIRPAAVIGHSSGEIAAAYAAQALTARGAITTAYYRGLVAAKQLRPGAMAAVNMGLSDLQPYLIDNVTAACDNSSTSVTISGDKDAVTAMLQVLQQARPDISVTLLQVDKAYHSPHMSEIADEYHTMLRSFELGATRPQILFFSSVFGSRLQEDQKLDATYWRDNLVLPVRFRTAAMELASCEIGRNAAFLEIGPHPMLAGPLRQTFAEVIRPSEAGVVHIATMVRRQDSAETFLNAVGRLFTMQVPIDLNTLYPDGVCLSDLPPYPWDYSRRYWQESRISKEWRQRQHPPHELLGVRTLESSSIEPSWRNMIVLDNVSWLREHCVGVDCPVLPFTAYIAMAGEAIRQITGVDDSFSVRHFNVDVALLLSEESPVEVLTSLRRKRLTALLESDWWEFGVHSFNGHAWRKHCSGEASSRGIPEQAIKDAASSEPLPRKVSTRRHYGAMHKLGMIYGSTFQVLGDIESSAQRPARAQAKIRMEHGKYEIAYHVHPIVLDATLQLISVAAAQGAPRNYRRLLPVHIDEMSVLRFSASTLIAGTSEVDSRSRAVKGSASCLAGSRVIASVRGVTLRLSEETDYIQASPLALNGLAYHIWRPDIDFMRTDKLFCERTMDPKHHQALEDLGLLGMLYANRKLTESADLEFQTIASYKQWLIGSAEGLDAATKHLDVVQIEQAFQAGLSALLGTPVAAIARVMGQRIHDHRVAMQHSSDPFATLCKNDIFYEAAHACVDDEIDLSSFFAALGHSKPRLQILQLGAEHGDASFMTRTLSCVGTALARYTYCSSKPLRLAWIKEKYQHLSPIDFAFWGGEDDPSQHGLSLGGYDLVVFRNPQVLPVRPDVLRNLGKLLNPAGRLYVQQQLFESVWTRYVFEPVMIGRDQLSSEPYDVEHASSDWADALHSAGFDTRHTMRPQGCDGRGPLCIGILASIEHTSPNNKDITILTRQTESDPHPLIKCLESRGYRIHYCTITDQLIPGQDVISLLDGQRPFLYDIGEVEFGHFQAFLSAMNGARLFWITRLSSSDPMLASILGLARTLRVERGLRFSVCQQDESSTQELAVAVFEKFVQPTLEHDIWSTEMEYLIQHDTVQIGRYFPRLEDEHVASLNETESVVLCCDNPGILGELHWHTRPILKLASDEIRVGIIASGVNYRDVLLAMGAIEVNDPFLGLEAAGIVQEVGENVHAIRVGARVVLSGRETAASTVVVSESLCAELPDSLDIFDAATMTSVYTTVIYALVDVAKLQRDQSVLIHSATGGIGLAAIHVARSIGASIYATVGSNEKAQFLVDTFGLQRRRIFSSRDVSFVEDVLQRTGGVGVDVALNSLSGELLHATWRCVAEFGIMIELGKRDLIQHAQLDMEIFLQNRAYHCIDMDRIRAKRPKVMKRLLNSMLQLYTEGQIHPIHPCTTFAATDFHKAVIHMKDGKHMGKILLDMRNVQQDILHRSLSIHREGTNLFSNSASYLLVGGLGGLGRSISVWMAENGARSLILLSRNAGKRLEHETLIEELKSMGCKVNVVQADITDMEAVNRTIQESPVPIKGVLQLSMVLRDERWEKMRWDEWQDTVRPKVQGTWNLHMATVAAEVDLDFFIMFSSMTGIVGQLGQANYAAANTFMDAFCEFRHRHGLQASSLAIGAVDEIGFLGQNQILASRMRNSGFLPVQESELLAALAVAIGKPVPNSQAHSPTIVLGLRAPDLGASTSAWLRDPRLAACIRIGSKDSEVEDKAQNLKAFIAEIRRDAAMLQADETIARFAQDIAQQVLKLLGQPSAEVDVRTRLRDLGMDSLLAGQLRPWVRQVFSIEISTMQILNMDTLEMLGKYITQLLLAMSESIL